MVLGKIIISILAISLVVYIIITPCDPSTDFVCCIENHNVTVYFEQQCHYSQNQMEILSNYAEYFEFVNCTANESACIDIPAVPAYRFNDKLDYGVKNTTDIMIMLGCRN